MARYVLELTLQDYSLCHFRPSVLAATVLTAAEEALGDGYLLLCPGHQALMDVEFRQALHEMRLMTEQVMLNNNNNGPSLYDILKAYAIKS